MHYATDATLAHRTRYVKAREAVKNSLAAVKLQHAKRALNEVVYRPHPDGLLIGSDGSITDNFSGFVLAPRLIRGKATVRASRKGVPHTWQVAQVVVETFYEGAMPRRKSAFQIEHMDGDPMNCAVDNLRLVLFAE